MTLIHGQINNSAITKDFYNSFKEERHCFSYNYKSDYHGLNGLEFLEFFIFSKACDRDIYSHYDSIGGITGLHISRDTCL